MNLRTKMEQAVETLVDISQSESVSAEDRVAACEAIISTYYEERESISRYGDMFKSPQTLSSGNSTMRGKP